MVERMMERTAYSKMENEGDRKTERPVERSIKRRFGKRMAGMLKTGLLFLPVLCLEGCAEAIPAGLGAWTVYLRDPAVLPIMLPRAMTETFR